MGKVTVVGGKPAMEAPSAGILASEIAVGSTVKLMENGTAVEYLVVHQGLPSSMYDASCDGTWLMRKSLHSSIVWDSSNNDYANSDIHAWLNNTFINTLGSAQSKIKQVKIPYRGGSGYSKTPIYSGSSGLSAKAFLLSGYEVAWNDQVTSYFPADGACLSFFSGFSAMDARRIAYLNGAANGWWLRSPYCNSLGGSISIWSVNIQGTYTDGICAHPSGIRPALILDSTALFDEETMLLKGVA